MTLPGKVSCALALSLSLGAGAAAQVNGPEFQINNYTTGVQYSTQVAADGGGRFVVVWAGEGQGDAYGVFARRYRSSGAPIGAEFRVNSSAGLAEGLPAVDAAAGAGFVVTWDVTDDGNGFGVFARRFDANGAPIGADFRVNSFTIGGQRHPDVAVAPNGSFVVVWNDVQAGADHTIRGRTYDSSGTPLASEFQVNVFGTAPRAHFDPQVTMVAGGGFVVVWDGGISEFEYAEIFARRYNAAGQPIDVEFRVNNDIPPVDGYASIASDASGAFVVSWQSLGDDHYDIFARRFDPAGDPVGLQFRVNNVATGRQYFPSVGSDRLGNFVVVWHDLGGDGDGYGVEARRYTSNGVAVGADFRVNTFTGNNQWYPSVAVDPRENFFVVWESNGQDGSASGIFGQRFGDFIFGDGFE